MIDVVTTSEQEIRNRRSKLGVSQILLARLVGVSSPTIYLWENGVCHPREENKTTLEKVLSSLEQGTQKCPSNHLLGYEWMQHDDCVICAHRKGCRRYYRYKVGEEKQNGK